VITISTFRAVLATSEAANEVLAATAGTSETNRSLMYEADQLNRDFGVSSHLRVHIVDQSDRLFGKLIADYPLSCDLMGFPGLS